MVTTFSFDYRAGDAARRREDATRRLLLIGDFSGRSQRGLVDVVSLSHRPVREVDVDSVDAAVARFAPCIDTALPDGTAAHLTFACIDDLHPHRLVERHAPLAASMSMRRRLLDPADFAAAAAEFGARPGTQAGAMEDDRAAVDRLLGGAPDNAGRTSAAAAAVQAFVRQIAAGDRANSLEFQPQYLAALDASAAAQLRALLHLPAFRALEAAWRSVQFLVSRLDFGGALQLYLLDATLDELRADAAQADGDAARSAFGRRLRLLGEDAADADAEWLFAGGLFSFGESDLDLLESLGAAALAAGHPIVAGADTSIAGECLDPSEWRAPGADVSARWQALRGSKAAAAIGLVVPRLLLRLPYGPDTDPIDAFAFAELSESPPSPAELLWGEGTLAAMLASAGDTDVIDVDDLPALTFSVDGARELLPCAEWLMGERVADRLIEYGLMPLLGSRHRNTVRLVGLRSIESH